jgi:hypothetical protein
MVRPKQFAFMYINNFIIFFKGNHEFYPADQYDFFGNTTEWLTGNLSQLWKEYLDVEGKFIYRKKIET